MLKDKIKEIGKGEGNNKKKIENVAFLIIVLISTIIIINVILDDDSVSSDKETNKTSTDKVLASISSSDETEDSASDLEGKLEEILSTIKGVGDVNVFINYSESSTTVAMYDEKTTVSSTEETDSDGGVRNTTSTETEKDVIYSEEDGDKSPVTEKIINPTIEGAIITAQGASSANVKTDIVNAVQAATGLSIDKIQVFEMK